VTGALVEFIHSMSSKKNSYELGQLLIFKNDEVNLGPPYMLVDDTIESYFALKVGCICMFLDVIIFSSRTSLPVFILVECNGKIGRMYTQYVEEI
jgi:hypothetical protein